MEVLAGVTAIIAVLQITGKIIHSSSEYIRGAKNATKSAERLRKELRDFRSILEELEEHVEGERAEGGLIAEMRFLKAIEEPLSECKLMLLDIENKLQIPSEAKRIKNALLWPFREKEVEKQIMNLRGFKESFHLALSLDNTALVKDVWKGVKTLNIAMNDATRNQILKWLETADPHINHALARSRHQPRTGLWFLESREFRSWQDSPKSFLWLHGIAGCGKTILSSSIIEHLRSQVSAESNALAYFYFDYKEMKDLGIRDFLSSVLAQLCRSKGSIPQVVQELYTLHTSQDQNSRPTTNILLDTLVETSKEWHHVFLVLDALDECDLQMREELLDVLGQIASSNADIRLLATSRPEADIVEALESIVDRNIPIRSERVDVDISLYVRSVLRTDTKMKKWPPSDKQLVEDTLIRKANGMFRWVTCQLDTLRKCMNRATVRRTLESLPKTLDQTYERIVLSIPEENRQQAIIALHWLSYTRRPLKLFELAEAVAVDVSEEDHYPFNPRERLFKPELILEICSSLVSASGTEHSTDVRLAHFSVQEYLLSDRIRESPAALFRVTLARGNAIMASFCVSYMLSMGSLEAEPDYGDDLPDPDEAWGMADTEPPPYSTKTIVETDPLLRYVVEYWYQHANSFIQHRPELSTMILQLLGHGAEGFGMVDWWNHAARFRIGLWYELSDIQILGGSIGVAAYLGLLPEVKLLLELDFGAGSRLETLGTALQAAAYGGHLDVTEMILSKGADPNSPGGLFGNPLQAAAHRGDKSVVTLLLKKGAKIDAEGGKHGTALQAAVSSGNREIAEFLLQSGANPNAGLGLGVYGSALQAAAYRVDSQLTCLLLERGAGPNNSGGKYGNALQAAAYRSSKDIVRILLEHGADPNIEGGEYGTALQAATHWGNTDIIKILLDHGANPNAASGRYLYGTALQAAANWGTKDIVELLLERGADPNLEAGNYGSALDAAVNRADGEICEMLLDKGAKIEVDDREFEGLLQSSLGRRGSKEIAGILIEKNADANAEFGCYGKAVQLAALKGYKEAVKLLKTHGGSALPEGLSARHYATLKLEENLALILTNLGPGFQLDYSVPFTPLHWAAWNNHAEVVNFISQNGSETFNRLPTYEKRPSLKGFLSDYSSANRSAGLSKIEDPFDVLAIEDWAPLHVAIFKNHLGIVNSLTNPDHDSDFGGDPDFRETTRNILASSSDLKVLKEHISVERCSGSLGWTAIHIAALLEKKSLLEHFEKSIPDFDIATPDANGMTPLHWVAAAGRKDMVEFLLSMHADADVKDNWKRTAADLAAGNARLEILNLLTSGKSDRYPTTTILSNGLNCACWRTCDSCDVVFQHNDLFLHCEACNDLDLCERCLLQERGCKDSSHSPEFWVLQCRMVSVSNDFRSVEDVLVSKAVPDRFSISV